MIQVIGTSHKLTDLAAREQLLHCGAAGPNVLPQLRERLGAEECALLSTCNRLECYFVSAEPAPTDTASRLLFRGAAKELTATCYHHTEEAAVAHLFAVASGLDSLILGEREILGQVKAALAEAQERECSGPVLTRLFHHALRTGRRARRETAISSGVFSAGQCAARRAREVLGELHGKRVLIFGAGRMAQVTAKHMAAAGAGPLAVFSRTRETARALAEHYDGRAVTASDLVAALFESDIVLGCAAAPHHLVRVAEIESAMAGRRDRPLVIVDLGVPRNVDPAVGEMPGVHLFNLDDLGCFVEEEAAARQAEVARVRAIVAEEVASFARRGRETEALIAQLRAAAEQVRQDCLSRACRRLAGEPAASSDGALAALDYATDLLVRKLLHGPITALRQAGDGADATEAQLAEAFRELFGLDDEG